jgi:hypothetical protein
LAYAFWGWSYVLFKIVCAVADHPGDVKIETVGVEDGGTRNSMTGDSGRNGRTKISGIAE